MENKNKEQVNNEQLNDEELSRFEGCKVSSFLCYQIDRNKITRNIYNLFINNQLFEPKTPDEMFYLGCYYELDGMINEQNNEQLIIKYYYKAYEKGHTEATYRLALQYKNEDSDFIGLMINYLIIASDAGHSGSSGRLAIYYEHIDKDYDQALKYHYKAIKQGNYNNVTTMFKLIKFLFNQKKLNMDLFHKILVDPKIDEFLPAFLQMYKNLYMKQVNILNLHFEYSPDSDGLGGEGYLKAKKEFNDIVLGINNKNNKKKE